MNRPHSSSKDSGWFLFTLLIFIAMVVVAWQHASGNLISLGFYVWVLLQFKFGMRAATSTNRGNRIAWWITSFAIATGASMAIPLPTTTLSLDVVKTPVSAEVTLNDLDHTNAGKPLTDPRAMGWVDSDWISRHSFGAQQINLRLDSPLRGTRHLELRFGIHPARYQLGGISVGTDVLGVAFPLVSWQGDAFAQAPFVKARRSTLKTLADGTVELLGPTSRPHVRVTLTPALVDRPSRGHSIGIRLLWFALYMGVPLLIGLLSRDPKRLVQRVRTVRHWLEAS